MLRSPGNICGGIGKGSDHGVWSEGPTVVF